MKRGNKVCREVIKEEEKKRKIIWIENLKIRKKKGQGEKPLEVIINYMFKNYGLNKRADYFWQSKKAEDWKIVEMIETEEYEESKKWEVNKNIANVILIYAIGDIMKYKVTWKFLMEIMEEKKEIVKKIIKSIEEYIEENKEWIYEEERSSEKINEIIKQVSIEIVNSEMIYIIRGKYSIMKKEEISKRFMEKIEEKKIKEKKMSIKEYIMRYFKEGWKEYEKYIEENMIRIRGKKIW